MEQTQPGDRAVGVRWTGGVAPFRWFGGIERVVKSIPYLIAFVALFAVYHISGLLLGRDAKLYFLIGMLAVYAFVGLALLIMRRRLWSGIYHLDEASRAKLLRAHPEVAEELSSSVGVSWRWRVLDAVLGITFVFGPPMLVSLARQQPLTLASEFTGWHLVAMAGGVGVYCLGRACVIRCRLPKQALPNGGLTAPGGKSETSGVPPSAS